MSSSARSHGEPILVLGATGTTGRRVTDRLRAAGMEVRAASRHGEVRLDWADASIWEPAVLAGELALPLGDLRQAFVDADDIATVAAAALTEDGHAGRGYEVTGPHALSFPDEQIQQEIVAFAALREQGGAQPTDVVRQVTRREPKDFETYATEAADGGAWRS